jgi:hypothetical protein
MHKLIFAVIVTAVLWGLWNLSQQDFTQVYQAETKEVIIDNTPAWATDADAVKAAEDVLKRKALEAELSQLESEIAERQTRIEAIETELGF